MKASVWPGWSTKAGRIWLAADALATLILGVLLGVIFLPVYGNGWLWVAVGGGTVLGMLIAIWGAVARLNAVLVVLSGAAVYLLFGGVLAMPKTTIGYVIPTGRTLSGLLSGPVSAWKAMLTIDPPLGVTGNLMTVPLILAMVLASVSLSISLRSKRPVWAWLPYVIAGLLGFSLGVDYSLYPLAVALASSAVIIVWTTYRRRHLRKTLVIQNQHLLKIPSALVGLIVLGAAGAITAASYPLLMGAMPRDVLRHIVDQPLDVKKYPSPLQAFRNNLTTNDSAVLFTIEGAPSGSVVHLAILDAYDGLTYNVSNSDQRYSDSGAFRRIGAKINTSATGDPIKASVRIGALRGPWVPLVGQVSDIEFTTGRKAVLSESFYANVASGTAVVTTGLSEGDGYTFTAVAPRQRVESEVRSASSGKFRLPETKDVPDRIRDDAIAFTSGAKTSGEAALRLEARLKQGYFSNGIRDQVASLPGHSYSRLNILLANPAQMVGDHEQYAVTMALMARDLDIPARVIYGYEVPSEGAGEVKGRDVGAWTELYLDKLGWVRFDPTPPKDRVLTNPTPPDPPELRPHVDSPPPPPRKPENAPNDSELEPNPTPPPPPKPGINWLNVLTYTVTFGVPTLIFVGVPTLILGLKSRRRKIRQNSSDLAKRFSGGWSELLDYARDMAKNPSSAATRSEQAVKLIHDFPRLVERADLMLLARQADSAVFSPDPVNLSQAERYWNDIGGALSGMKDSVTQYKWWSGRLSVRSFRKYR